MNITYKYRTLLLASGSVLMLAACTNADVDDVVSPGDATPIVVTPVGGGGGGGATAPAAFAARSTAPISAADCPEGTIFIPGVNVVDESGASTSVTTSFCSLTPEGSDTITGTVNVGFSPDPILIQGTVFIGDGTEGSANVTFAEGQTFITRNVGGVVDLLVVSRGSELNAVGSDTNPIIFTSMPDFVDDLLPNGTGNTGDWGGLVINGFASLNECGVDNGALPGVGDPNCIQEGEGGSGVFGGNEDTDSSGNFQFIRVQHGGFQFTPDNELNSVALQGVGNGTIFQFIQVHDGADDGFEWFGGTVDASNLIVTGAGDDSFDWTDGWTGSAQFLLAVQNPGDDNGIEGDNETPFDAMPRSNPQISNMTLIGGGDGTSGEGILLRVGTDANIANAIVTNFSQGFEFDNGGDPGTVIPTVNSTIVAGNGDNLVDSEAIFAAGDNNVEGAGVTLDGVLPGPAEIAAVSVSPETIDAAFDADADFVGAFSPTDPFTAFPVGWTVPGSIPGVEPAPAECPAGTVVDVTDAPSDFPGRSEALTCVLATNIVGDVTLTAGNLYRLDGTISVGIDLGSDPAAPAASGQRGVLTIEPGVTIFGDCNGDGAQCGSGVVDLLVVSRGSELDVNGSSIAPVVLTSRLDLESGGGVRSATGEIGGIAINGRAPLNECDTGAIGDVDCEQEGEGGSGFFGGATPDDTSGSINFMQIRYAGFQFTPDNELNALALQGVGSGTDLDFIQILNGADDGVEWFGGTASASHVVVTGAGDDSLDWTDGWSGTVQFAIVAQNPGDDNGIEGDNETPFDVLPRSRPFMTNMTFIGGGDGASGEGVLLRVGTGGTVANTVVTQFSQGVEFDDQGSDVPTVASIAVSENGTDLVDTGTLSVAGDGLVVFANNTLGAIPGFSAPLAPGANETAPNINAVDPVALCDAEFASIPAGEQETDPAAPPFTSQPSQCFQLESAAYVGALEDENDTWFAGWTIGL